MELDYLSTYENLRETFTNFKEKEKNTVISSYIILQRASDYLDGLTLHGLIDVLYKFHSKWPHCRNKDILLVGAKRTIQAKFYQQVYGHPPSENVLIKDRTILEQLHLNDEPYKPTPKTEKITNAADKIKEIDKAPRQPKETQEKMAKEKKPKSEFAQKVADKTLDEVIKWALEIGVTQDKIDKHKDKPLGLAKMNISNLIKGQLNRKEKEKKT